MIKFCDELMGCRVRFFFKNGEKDEGSVIGWESSNSGINSSSLSLLYIVNDENKIEGYKVGYEDPAIFICSEYQQIFKNKLRKKFLSDNNLENDKELTRSQLLDI